MPHSYFCAPLLLPPKKTKHASFNPKLWYIFCIYIKYKKYTLPVTFAELKL